MSLNFLPYLQVFQNRPPTPPSRAQEGDVKGTDGHYIQSIRRLLTNGNYVLLLLTYGMNVGVFYAISTLLNRVVVMHYEDAEEDAGRMGLIIVISGMLGSMVCGFVLDKTHQYKKTTLAVYVLSFVGMVLYTFTIRLGYLNLVYGLSALLGFFMTGYLPLGFDFAVEITYPESEGTSSGLLNASAQIFGIVSTILAEQLLTATKDDRIANGALSAVLLLGSVMTAFIKPDYKRQIASKVTAAPPVVATTEPGGIRI